MGQGAFLTKLTSPTQEESAYGCINSAMTEGARWTGGTVALGVKATRYYRFEMIAIYKDAYKSILEAKSTS